MHTISDLGNAILSHLERLGRRLDYIVSPPLEKDEVITKLEDIGIHPVKALVDLYCWHDGAQENPDLIMADV